jgi:hypothetical protein
MARIPPTWSCRSMCWIRQSFSPSIARLIRSAWRKARPLASFVGDACVRIVYARSSRRCMAVVCIQCCILFSFSCLEVLIHLFHLLLFDIILFYLFNYLFNLFVYFMLLRFSLLGPCQVLCCQHYSTDHAFYGRAEVACSTLHCGYAPNYFELRMIISMKWEYNYFFPSLIVEIFYIILVSHN